MAGDSSGNLSLSSNVTRAQFVTMMTAASQALAATVPEMAEEILAFAAASNVATNLDGVYMELFVSLPVANFIYKKLAPLRFGKNNV